MHIAAWFIRLVGAEVSAAWRTLCSLWQPLQVGAPFTPAASALPWSDAS